MKHLIESLMLSEDIDLHVQRWIPEPSPVATLIIVHGLAEYGGRYHDFARRLSTIGFQCIAMDLRGHGQSPGKRAYVFDIHQFVQDVAILIDKLKSETPQLPIFLFGQSMGGAIAALYAIWHQNELSGLILFSAALKIHDNFSPLLQKLSSLIAALFPTLPTLKLDSNLISRDPAVVQTYANDPMIYHGGTLAKTGAEIIKATREIQSQAQRLTLPLYIAHGSGDKITDPEGSQRVYDLAASADKTLKLYPNLFHELHNEPEKEQVYSDLMQWLKKHVPKNNNY
jgi:alpha-beta hydrolase superfamily lysophospholipase